VIILVSLLDPLEVKGLTLKNRIVIPPMQTSLATTKGAVTDKLIEYYVRRSGALGLVIVEHSYVSLNGKLTDRQLGIYDEILVSGLEKLSRSIHATGTPVVIQINHAGRNASKEVTGIQPVAPSPSENARHLKVKEIESLVEAYSLAAGRAIQADFDGVEVHGAHGFLLNQFYSPLTNRRNDRYGGSLENRMRFPLDVVKRVKKKLGKRLLLYRLGSVDLDPAGTQIEDSKKFAAKLEAAGVDIIDVSGGLCGSSPAQLQNIQGYFIPQAREIKKVVDVPVIGAGGITEPEHANNVIRDKKVDLVAIGRALLNDPDWAVKAIKKLKA
jgi:NADPH2 dehydrogenase